MPLKRNPKPAPGTPPTRAGIQKSAPWTAEMCPPASGANLVNVPNPEPETGPGTCGLAGGHPYERGILL